MNREDIIRMAQEAGLFIAYDTEGHFSGVVDSEMIDMYPDRNKERDRLNREQRFVEILTPFAALVASAEREACAKACEDKAERYAERAAKPENERDINRDTARIAQQTCFHLADNIRARGQA
jgi:hypothetical protein